MATTATSTDTKRKNADANSSKLVPIRVDVLSDDKTIRIVDTLIIDRTCWPVTLYQPLYVSVEENITQLAHTIISDAEVQVSVVLDWIEDLDWIGLKINPASLIFVLL